MCLKLTEKLIVFHLLRVISTCMSAICKIPSPFLPPHTTSTSHSQMEIFDAYVEDLIQQEKAKEKAKGAKSTATVLGVGGEGEKKKGSSELQVGTFV